MEGIGVCNNDDGPGSVGSNCPGGPANNLQLIDKVDHNGGTEGMSRHIKETNLSSYAH